MCVIIVAEKRLPSKKNLMLCEEHNADGGGISWVEDGLVHWKKGINGNEMWNIMNSVKLPIVAHFRIGTIGGKHDLLTHPFPITKECSVALEGKAESVLFHNGHWHDWDRVCMQMVLLRKLYFPMGPWSDSRAIAWIVKNTNNSVLRLIGGKFAIHNTNNIYKYSSGWETVDDVLYSNDLWQRKYSLPRYDRGWGLDYGKEFDRSYEPIGLIPELKPETIDHDSPAVDGINDKYSKDFRREM